MTVLGLFSTGIATLIYFRIIQGPGPAFLSLINYMVPAWAVLIGAVFLDEQLTLGSYVGMLMILSGLAVSELVPRIRLAVRTRLGPASAGSVAPPGEDA